MNKFLGLLKKDYLINKKSLYMPIFIVIGFYLLNFAIFGLAYLKGDINMDSLTITGNLNINDVENIQNVGEFLSYLGMVSQMAFPALISLIIMLTLSQGALNDGIRNKCEMFHRSHPVSEWKIAGSRFLATVVGPWLSMIPLMILNIILIGIIFTIVGIPFNLWYSIVGGIQVLMNFFAVGLLIGGFLFLFSAIFKDKAFLKLFLIMIGIQISSGIFNGLYGWKIPHIFPVIFKTLIKGFRNFASFSSIGNIENSDFGSIVAENWILTFNWSNLSFIIFSGLFFVAATYIYKYKEVK